MTRRWPKSKKATKILLLLHPAEDRFDCYSQSYSLLIALRSHTPSSNWPFWPLKADHGWAGPVTDNLHARAEPVEG
jgi:hypothetical protein